MTHFSQFDRKWVKNMVKKSTFSQKWPKIGHFRGFLGVFLGLSAQKNIENRKMRKNAQVYVKLSSQTDQNHMPPFPEECGVSWRFILLFWNFEDSTRGDPIIL